jgi:fatty acid desaturase
MGLGGRATAKGRSISMEEVRKHNNGVDDSWIVIHGKVYDISRWAGESHPGGRTILTAAGDDATDSFTAFHPKSTWAMLERFYVGDVEGAKAKKDDFEAAYRRLRTEILRRGWDRASPAYYVWKTLSTLSIGALGAMVAVRADGSSAWLALSAVIIALFWQQCGWLSHDYMHHQVFDNRWYGDLMSYLIGNVCQGFSVEWWKNKHNTHHAVPNMHESAPEAHDGDPDIETMPVLAWSLKLARKVQTAGAVGRFSVRNQSLLYFPILALARISWLQQSFMYVWGEGGAWGEVKSFPLRHPVPEYTGLALYYAWYGCLMAATCSPLQALMYILVSQCVCGVFLAIPFGVGHNGMATFDYDNKPDFATLQVLTTRNIEDDALGLTGWFCGGLHLQVEHHLFPAVPRHNLHKIRALVEPLAKQHGVRYHSQSLWAGTWEVLGHLRQVTEDLVAEFPGL